jgi:lipid-A-disaccharide synthase
MRIFISAGEPSGDLHGSNLTRALRQMSPDAECVGYGGERMEAVGCRLLYPLASFPVIGVGEVIRNGSMFLDLLARADQYFQRQLPEAVVLIDYPGFNWWIARRAHAHGIPVYYFVPPQLWAWAGWRVAKMRRFVDHVLCNLPFEQHWYRARRVRVHYVGHPYFDELARQSLDDGFIRSQQSRQRCFVALLPGSRSFEVKHNFPSLVKAAEIVHGRRPETHFLVACFKNSHQAFVNSYLRDRDVPFIETCVGRTPDILHLAHCCVAVSGSVGLEMLYHGKPSVVTYRVKSYHLVLTRFLKKSRYISLVNLLAEKELFPEFLTDRCPAEAMAEHVVGWLSDRTAYERLRGELKELRDRVAKPGACEKAARYIIQTLCGAEPRAA